MEYPYNEKLKSFFNLLLDSICLNLLLDTCYFVYDIEMWTYTYVIIRHDRAKEFRTIRVLSGELRRAVVGKIWCQYFMTKSCQNFMRLSFTTTFSCGKTNGYHFFMSGFDKSNNLWYSNIISSSPESSSMRNLRGAIGVVF